MWLIDFQYHTASESKRKEKSGGERINTGGRVVIVEECCECGGVGELGRVEDEPRE
jgi:hypothetical protein